MFEGRTAGRGPLSQRHLVIESSRLQPRQAVSLATKAANRGCTGGCDGADDVGPPGEIRGGFSFEPAARTPFHAPRDGNAIPPTFVPMLEKKKGRQFDLDDPSSTCGSSTFSGRLLDLRTGGLSPGRIQLGNHC
jgi:hypothetical protein